MAFIPKLGTPFVVHATEGERKARFHGCESRQVLRAQLRTKYPRWGDAYREYRELMGLVVVRLPNGKFRVEKGEKNGK